MNTLNWQKFNKVFSRKKELCRGEEKQLTETQILEINHTLEKMIELEKIIDFHFESAVKDFGHFKC